jgi:hypothetical protein
MFILTKAENLENNCFDFKVIQSNKMIIDITGDSTVEIHVFMDFESLKLEYPNIPNFNIWKQNGWGQFYTDWSVYFEELEN